MGNIAQIQGNRELISRIDDLGNGRFRLTRRILYQGAGNVDDAMFEALGTALSASYTTKADETKFQNLVLIDQYEDGGTQDRMGAVVLVKVYETLTSTTTRVGDIVTSVADERAFVGTNGSGAVISTTQFAREWTARYIVVGDVSGSDTVWRAVSATQTFGGKTGYLTGATIVARVNGFSLVDYRYTEVPDRLVYLRAGQYTFPASLGYSSDLGPYVAQPSTTRETQIEIEETYQVGEVAADALEFEVLWWAEGVVSYTRATGEDGARGYEFPGAIGSVSVSITNKIFDGALCSVATGTVASNHVVSGGGQAFPDYPSGKKLVSSRPMPWRGNIWKLVNTYVTFP